ncbi:hypothetical protein D3C83_89880 [compost metagenome]
MGASAAPIFWIAITVKNWFTVLSQPVRRTAMTDAVTRSGPCSPAMPYCGCASSGSGGRPVTRCQPAAWSCATTDSPAVSTLSASMQ